ncbi:MAG: NAD(P)-dependent oxidoreductase [Hyphomonadaceae bacterium]|nr:NAD(P)-dependent oxidoreductase [Hyphomonadaceae bacterium]
MTHIAFLGLGAMGARMAAHLARAGHQLAVWNRTPGRADALVSLGAREAATAADAAARAQIVIAMVRDDDASRAVWLDPDVGALHAMTPGALAIECSTLTPAWTQALAAHASARGINVLEAPLAGSRPQADARALTFFLGGRAADAMRAAPLLDAMGAASFPVGGVGAGATVKLAVNAMLVAQVAMLAELKGFLERAGVDAAAAMEALNATAVASPAVKAAAASMLAGAYAPLFPIALADKDCRYALATAHTMGAALPLTSAAQAVLSQAQTAGLGGDHLSAVAKLYTKGDGS